MVYVEPISEECTLQIFISSEYFEPVVTSHTFLSYQAECMDKQINVFIYAYSCMQWGCKCTFRLG